MPSNGTLIPCFGLTGTYRCPHPLFPPPHTRTHRYHTPLTSPHEPIPEATPPPLLNQIASSLNGTANWRYSQRSKSFGLNVTNPDGVRKGNSKEGCTVMLLERDHLGLRTGSRHISLNAAFMNGTVKGDNVWIPMRSILGVQERCWFCWNRFVDCLAEGRGVSLPTGRTGLTKTVVCGVGGDLMALPVCVEAGRRIGSGFVTEGEERSHRRKNELIQVDVFEDPI